MKIYVSHSIRGKDGENATPEIMKANNERAIDFGNELKRVFPNIEIYVPGEHDEFPMRAMQDGFLGITQVLAIDCHIISTCGLVLVYAHDQFISDGMLVEIYHAQKNNIPCHVCNGVITGVSAIELWLETLKR